MKTFLIMISCLAMSTQAYAMGEVKDSEELINQQMCREHNHHFSDSTKDCSYCAHHLTYDKMSKECVGELSILGKCIGDDHFRAATLECVYCAEGYEFNEDTRRCESTQIILAD